LCATQARLTAFQSIAVRRFIDQHVRHDAFGLDRAAARRVVARGGQLDRRIGGELANGLHRTLAESLRAHDGGALVILQRAGTIVCAPPLIDRMAACTSAPAFNGSLSYADLLFPDLLFLPA